MLHGRNDSVSSVTINLYIRIKNKGNRKGKIKRIEYSDNLTPSATSTQRLVLVKDQFNYIISLSK